MPNSFTVVTNQSWFSRIGQSIKSVLVGLVLFIASFPVLYWNEARAVRTANSLEEGAGAVVSVQADRVDPGSEGKLVHLSGEVTTAATLTDEDFGVSANALQLVRTVSMYQWIEEEKSEEKKKLGGGTETVTTYTYKKGWSEDAVDSSSFTHPEGHENPGELPVASQTLTADPITLGAFTLSEPVVAQIGGAKDLPVNAEAAATIPEEYKERLHVAQDRFYMGANPASPQVGDARISFEVIPIGPRSIVARQVGDTFESYQAKAGDAILLVDEGIASAEGMFATAQAENQTLTWILRAVGALLMFLGLLMVFKPIAVFGDVVPLIGTMLGAGLGIFSFLIAASLSLLTIAVSWIVVRPVLGLVLLALALGAIVGLISIGMKKKKSRAALAPATA